MSSLFLSQRQRGDELDMFVFFIILVFFNSKKTIYILQILLKHDPLIALCVNGNFNNIVN